MENISITGITPLDYYPNSKCIINNKQNMQTIDVCVPCEKPEIEEIEEVKVNICSTKFKIIETILGPKLIFNGIMKIKVIYTANNCEQSLHSAHWEISFCDFILLDNLCNTSYDINCADLFAGLEDVCINYYDCRLINLSILYIICVSFDKEMCNSNCSSDKHNKDICCEDKQKSKCNKKNSNLKGCLNTYYYPVDHY